MHLEDPGPIRTRITPMHLIQSPDPESLNKPDYG